jgi:hypothetical protein
VFTRARAAHRAAPPTLAALMVVFLIGWIPLINPMLRATW